MQHEPFLCVRVYFIFLFHFMLYTWAYLSAYYTLLPLKTHFTVKYFPKLNNNNKMRLVNAAVMCGKRANKHTFITNIIILYILYNNILYINIIICILWEYQKANSKKTSITKNRTVHSGNK